VHGFVAAVVVAAVVVVVVAAVVVVAVVVVPVVVVSVVVARWETVWGETQGRREGAARAVWNPWGVRSLR